MRLNTLLASPMDLVTPALGERSQGASYPKVRPVLAPGLARHLSEIYLESWNWALVKSESQRR